jgi:hypothetical protein
MSEQLTLLITKADIVPYAQIAIHAREEAMLQPHILAAQNVDVKPVIGGALWYDVLQNPYTALNQKLIDGGTYIDASGQTQYFQGIKAALACFAYARYVLSKNAVDTPFGMVAKTNDFSVQADAKILLNIASEKRSEGSAYLNECMVYLNESSINYPLYEATGQPTTKSIHKLTPASRI